MYELIDSELDMVTGGAQGNGNAFGGLIAAAVGVNVDHVNVLNNNRVDIPILNASNVPIGIAVAILGTSANAIRAG